MRRSHVCPKCKHNRILLFKSVTSRGVPVGAWHQQGAFYRSADLRAVVCKACGHTELFLDDADEIEVDGEWVRELVGPSPHGPYR